MWTVKILSMVTAVAAIGYSDLLDELTAEELKRVFNVERGSEPKYEIVPIDVQKLNTGRRSAYTEISLNAFGRRIDLPLKPTGGVLVEENTPVYVAMTDETSRTGFSVFIDRDVIRTVGSLFENQERRASILIKETSSGRISMYGNLGNEGLVIKPLPSRFNGQVLSNKYRRSGDNFEDSSSEYHVIYESNGPPEGTHYADPIIEIDPIRAESRNKPHSIPGTVYPQLFIIADHETYKRHGNLYNLVEYLLPFWNGVDLAYRNLKYPEVRFNIAGIMVAADDKALSFISRNQVLEGVMNITGAVVSLSSYMANVAHYFPPDSYDIAVAMSSYKMCRSYDFRICEFGVLGVAFLSGACGRFKSSTVSVAVVQDKGAFDGIHTTTHELGHLFGAKHDGVEYSVCTAEAGHIMSPFPRFTNNSADWSQCTLKEFDNFFKSKKSKCLFNKPDVTSLVHPVLPGKLLTIDELCEKLTGTKSCQNKTTNKNICTSMTCTSKNRPGVCIRVGYAPPDGTICGTGKICRHRNCVYETETNVFPLSY